MTTVVGTPPGVTASGYKVAAGPTLPVSGAIGWWDSSDASSFTFSSGSVVSQWRDLSGNNRHFGQANVGWQPSRTGTQNGLSTLVFDGVIHRLETAAPISTAVDNFTMFVACKRTGGNASFSVVFHNGTASNGYGIALRANGVRVGVLRGGVGWTPALVDDPAAPGVLSLRRAAGTWSLFLNGATTNLSLSAAPTAPTTFARIVNAEHLFGGQVYEAIFYNTALSDVNRAAVDSYLRTKWGTP